MKNTIKLVKNLRDVIFENVSFLDQTNSIDQLNDLRYDFSFSKVIGVIPNIVNNIAKKNARNTGNIILAVSGVSNFFFCSSGGK